MGTTVDRHHRTLRFKQWHLTAAMIFALGNACASGNGPSTSTENFDASTKSDDTIPVVIQTDRGPVTFRAEVVDSPAGRQRGLMFREHLPELTGMLFLFPDESQRSFWMRNTLIPLDIIFVTSEKRILGIVENATPKTDTPRKVQGRSQYVLELIGGSASRYRLTAGQTLEFYAPAPER